MSTTSDPAPTGTGDTERTVAFFADPRAAVLLLEDTVSALIEDRSIDRGLIDMSTLPGLAVARAFQRAGIPFHSLEYGQEARHNVGPADRHPIHAPVIASDADDLLAAASASDMVAVGELGTIDANVVVIPAMLGDNEKLIDFSQGSLVGAVVTQLEEARRDLVLIDTPERGLRRRPDGTYLRAVIHVAASDESA